MAQLIEGVRYEGEHNGAIQRAFRGHYETDRDTVAGTALTNSTTETAVTSHTFPANSLFDGAVIEWEGLVRATATNATDELTPVVYFGPVSLTTAIATPSGANVDVANNDIFWAKGTITIRDGDSSGSYVAVTMTTTTFAASGSQAAVDVVYSIGTTIDFTADLLLEIGCAWSVANAGNSCQSEIWNVSVR